MKTLLRCPQCKTAQRDGNYCKQCGTALEALADAKNVWKPVGIWHVTTEGDEEGRSTRDLGVHEGHVVDIAKKLSPRVFYSLEFSPVFTKDKVEEAKPLKEVPIHLAIDSGTWDLKQKDREAYFRKMFTDRDDVKVDESNYFACVTLKFKETKK